MVSAPPILERFFDKHGSKLTTLLLDSDISAAVNAFKSCTQLATLSIDCVSGIHVNHFRPFTSTQADIY
jgi:hypothetical protein